MEHGDLLATIAEVAIALTGFTGFVAVLGKRSGGRWSPHELLQLRALVETSLTAFFVSFVSMLLAMVLQSEAEIWSGSNLVLGLAHLGNLATFFLRTRAAPATTSQALMAIVGLAFITAHLLAGAGVLPQGKPIFVLGLLQQIFVAAHNFVLLLIPTKQPAA